MTHKKPTQETQQSKDKHENKKPAKQEEKPEEFGGPQGPEPTRYGDWERGGRCSDF